MQVSRNATHKIRQPVENQRENWMENFCHFLIRTFLYAILDCCQIGLICNV